MDYRGLAVTGRSRVTQAGYELVGLCYSEDRLYMVERPEESDRYNYKLAVYRVQSDSGHITRLDTLTGLGKGDWSQCPRVDRHSRRVFIPCWDSGLTVARLDGDRLVRERTLPCVRYAVSVDFMSPDTLYVGDRASGQVHVLDVRNDRPRSRLRKPFAAKDKRPYRLAVLGDSVMVGYGNSILVVYRHGSPDPVRVMSYPGGLEEVTSVSTDFHSNFIVTDRGKKSVFVVDASGKLRHTLNIGTDSWTVDCAVVNRQLWLGCLDGDIVIMSSSYTAGDVPAVNGTTGGVPSIDGTTGGVPVRNGIPGVVPGLTGDFANSTQHQIHGRLGSPSHLDNVAYTGTRYHQGLNPNAAVFVPQTPLVKQLTQTPAAET